MKNVLSAIVAAGLLLVLASMVRADPASDARAALALAVETKAEVDGLKADIARLGKEIETMKATNCNCPNGVCPTGGTCTNGQCGLPGCTGSNGVTYMQGVQYQDASGGCASGSCGSQRQGLFRGGRLFGRRRGGCGG